MQVRSQKLGMGQSVVLLFKPCIILTSQLASNVQFTGHSNFWGVGYWMLVLTSEKKYKSEKVYKDNKKNYSIQMSWFHLPYITLL